VLRTLLARIAPQNDGWLAALFGAGTAGVWLPGSLFVGTFITEDLSCVAAGIFAAEGRIDIVTATIACTLGIWLGDIGLYLIGWLTARGLLRWGWARRKMDRLGNSSWRTAFEQHGNKILFTSRFLPGTRVPSYLVAGAIGFSLLRFATVLGIAVVIWTPLLVGAAAISGKVVLDVLEQWGAYAWIAVPCALLVAWLVLRLLTLLTSWRGRRLLLGRWRRMTRWEYWPPLFVFPPVVLDLVRTAIVHRTPAVFTACNRGIPFGGLFGESKGDILDLLHGDVGDGGVSVAGYRRLRHGATIDERLAEVRPFLAAGRCVLKPDQGERGAGVVVVRSEDEARAWLESCPHDAIVQQFVDGAEFGISWCRDPETGRGQIHSITHKVLPAVVGDGEASLEELILGDPRQVAMAPFHLKKQAARLQWVPAAGERVSLGDLGTHARGATFYDVRSLATPALHAAFDRYLGDVPEVDFGRFDVRAPDREAVAAGRGIRVLEFNGVTGEATHVYQPGYPWWRGVRDMIAHLRRASRIGAANRRAGHRPATMRQLFSVLFDAWRRPAFEYDAAGGRSAEPGPGGAVSNALPRDARGA
jgi:membrane protein DedA with SNARE-associated domain